MIQTQALDSPNQCKAVAEATADMLRLQAKTNLSAPHNQISISKDKDTGALALSTGMGREIGRVICVKTEM